ncbi:MAG: helix-turn-helix domain-containing protein [Candidatus Odinarchaeota archaeon]
MTNGNGNIESIFSSSARVKILSLLLNEKPAMTLSELKNSLGGSISHSEVSRHLAKLGDLKLVQKESFSTRNYILTPLGQALMISLSTFNFLVKNEEYFRNHSLEYLPDYLVKRIDELSGARLVGTTALAEVIGKLQRVEHEALVMGEETLLYGEYGNPKAKGIVKVITTPSFYKEFFASEKYKEVWPFIVENLEIRLLPATPVNMAIYDFGRFGDIVFPLIDNQKPDHGTFFIIEDVQGIKYLKEVWEYFWEESERL